jgi:hypothetical protein
MSYFDNSTLLPNNISIACKFKNVTHYYIETSQPIVGLPNRALLGSRPVKEIPRRRDDVTLQE